MAAAAQEDEFPLDDDLRGSLHYPTSGFDGGPVRYLVGNVFSFVYIYIDAVKEVMQVSTAGLAGAGFPRAAVSAAGAIRTSTSSAPGGRGEERSERQRAP